MCLFFCWNSNWRKRRRRRRKKGAKAGLWVSCETASFLDVGFFFLQINDDVLWISIWFNSCERQKEQFWEAEVTQKNYMLKVSSGSWCLCVTFHVKVRLGSVFCASQTRLHFCFFFFFYIAEKFDFSTNFQSHVGLVYCLWTHKFYFSTTFSLKMGLMVLFTHLKIILLQYFSVFSFQLYPTDP